VRAARRSVLKGSALLGAAAALPAAARAAQTVLTVYDSRLPESLAFARTRRGAKFDLAQASNRALPAASRIEGLTGWSDWIDLRGEYELRGLRLAGEAPVSAPLSGKSHLFRWSLKVR
jgi:hypothetical protein